MSGKSVNSRVKMRISIYQVLFIISPLIRCLCGAVDVTEDYNRVGCGHSGGECVIEAFLGSFETGDEVEVLINCTSHDELLFNNFLVIDRITWNGCHSSRNIPALGLSKISRKNQVKILEIENFAVGVLEAGTFDGFYWLETLSFRRNSIENLSSSCFRALVNLRTLTMNENNLKWIDSGVLNNLPKLNTLQIVGNELLLMANHQFSENQVLDDVVMEINRLETDLFEHFLSHVRNLSIFVKSNDGEFCNQIRVDGYEKPWLVENLKLNKLRCGISLKNAPSIKSLELDAAVQWPYTYATLELQHLPNLEVISLHENFFDDSFPKFSGSFDHVKVFDMSNNTLSEIDMRTFKIIFKNLNRINLNENFLQNLKGLSSTNFENVQLLVNGNNFDCSWLNGIASSKAFQSFVYTKNFQTLNLNGLSCSNRQCVQSFPPANESFSSSLFMDSADNEAQRKLLRLKQDNFILRPEIFVITVCASALMGVALAFISIYTHRKRLMMKQQPFYHLLRDSMLRTKITLRRDLGEILSRNLPPTNYEHPISDSNVTEMSGVDVNTNNLYEEIPQKLY